MANTKLQIIGPTLSAWPGTSHLSHWKKRFLGLFGTTFLGSVSLCSASARLPLWCTSKRSIKGQEVMLAGLPSGRGRARGAQHQVPQTEVCSIRPSSPHIPMHWARKKSDNTKSSALWHSPPLVSPIPPSSLFHLPFSPITCFRVHGTQVLPSQLLCRLLSSTSLPTLLLVEQDCCKCPGATGPSSRDPNLGQKGILIIPWVPSPSLGAPYSPL